MGANTLAPPRSAGDGGSGNEQDWHQWSAEVDGTDAYVVEDVGRRSLLVSRAALRGLDPDVHTDRVMPRRSIPQNLSDLVMPKIIIK